MKNAVRLSLVLSGSLALVPSPAAAQTLAWENRGQPEFGGTSIDVDGTSDTVVAVGTVYTQQGDAQWYVRGVDRRTGATSWEDRFGPVAFGQARDVSVRGNRAFVTGWIATSSGFVFVTRAYRLETGAVLWSREVGLGPQCLAEVPGWARCVAKALDVDDGRVFAVGHLTRTANQSDFAVLAYDAATGAPLWESVTDSGTGAFDYAWAVKAVDDSVYVYGETNEMTGVRVQAHDARTGAIRWSRDIPGAHNFTLRQTLAADRRHVFIGGTDGDGHFMLHAYDARTGALRWTDQAQAGEAFGEATALTLEEDHGQARLFATGVTGCNASLLDCEWAVRAYDPRHGRLWARAEVARGGDWGGGEVVVAGERLVANAAELQEDGKYHIIARAFQTRTGAPLWEEPFDPGVDPPAIRAGLAAGGGSLFVHGGLNTGPDFARDFIVRRYRTHGHGSGHEDEDDGDEE